MPQGKDSQFHPGAHRPRELLVNHDPWTHCFFTLYPSFGKAQNLAVLEGWIWCPRDGCLHCSATSRTRSSSGSRGATSVNAQALRPCFRFRYASHVRCARPNL